MAVAIAGGFGTSHAQPSEPRRIGTTSIERAGYLLDQGDHDRARKLATQALATGLADSDVAEAHRIVGIASFFLRDLKTAEQAFFEYLTLDADAHLDPALYPPEVIVFFEDVRARRSTELATLRPKPESKSGALNLLPPLGQFQNGDTAKGWTIAALGTALLATSITSWVLLNRWCDDGNFTCPGRYEDARDMQVLNLVSVVGLAGVYAYGVFDGFIGYRSQGPQHRQSTRVGVTATPDGAGLVITGRF